MTVFIKGSRTAIPVTSSGYQVGAVIFNTPYPIKKAKKIILSEHKKIINPVNCVRHVLHGQGYEVVLLILLKSFRFHLRLF